jgi:hypothetical protein
MIYGRGLTLLFVPVLYSIFVLDFKIVAWGEMETHERAKFRYKPGVN